MILRSLSFAPLTMPILHLVVTVSSLREVCFSALLQVRSRMTLTFSCALAVEMADILAFNLCQTSTKLGTFKPRKMNNPDLSTKLKLMGVDVASFGDFFADQSLQRGQTLVETVPRTRTVEIEAESSEGANASTPEVRNGKRVKQAEGLKEEEIKSLVFRVSLSLFIFAICDLQPDSFRFFLPFHRTQ